jgi:hypothetical protein
MVKCPECGIEYSLGRKIIHSCNKFRIEHGTIWCSDRKELPWNCDPIAKRIESNVERIEFITSMKKLIHAVKF